MTSSKALGVPIDHCVSHAYEEMGNTVSCYFLDPEGNRLEIYALVSRARQCADQSSARPRQELDEIVAQASGLHRRRRFTEPLTLRRWRGNDLKKYSGWSAAPRKIVAFDS